MNLLAMDVTQVTLRSQYVKAPSVCMFTTELLTVQAPCESHLNSMSLKMIREDVRIDTEMCVRAV